MYKQLTQENIIPMDLLFELYIVNEASSTREKKTQFFKINTDCISSMFDCVFLKITSFSLNNACFSKKLPWERRI